MLHMNWPLKEQYNHLYESLYFSSQAFGLVVFNEKVISFCVRVRKWKTNGRNGAPVSDQDNGGNQPMDEHQIETV